MSVPKDDAVGAISNRHAVVSILNVVVLKEEVRSRSGKSIRVEWERLGYALGTRANELGIERVLCRRKQPGFCCCKRVCWTNRRSRMTMRLAVKHISEEDSHMQEL
jgi:hypothetical protein